MNNAWSADFTYTYYRRLLDIAKANFELHCFNEAHEAMNRHAGKPVLLLRHDIDIDLNIALEMAVIEHEMNVRSTYMVMLNAPCYDINTEESKAILQQLMLMGHEVALHFDIDKNKRDNPKLTIDDVESEISNDLKQLELIINRPVSSISFHRPIPQFLNGPFKIASVVNAYSKQLMAWYLSDSAGRWRDGEPLPKLLNPTANILQLLIHPIWWGASHIAGPERLEAYFKNRTAGWTRKETEAFDNAMQGHIGIRRSGINNYIAQNHLPEKGKFNTDASALLNRIKSHERFGNQNLNEWIFQHLNIEKGDVVLDLGCGTGKQTIPAAKLSGDEGKIVAFDASQKALDILMIEGQQSNLEKNIITICNDFNNLSKSIKSFSFDKALASYSLYYAENIEEVFTTIKEHLKPGGIFFFCGPSKENNAALKRFHSSLFDVGVTLPESKAALFMQEIGESLSKKHFSKTEVYTFKNELQFDTATALYDYWRSYNLYDETLDDQFRSAAIEYFKNHSHFKTVKQVLGIRATK
jgi:ubiquinone/menaquinone biosynthesis C-methylase UbiE